MGVRKRSRRIFRDRPLGLDEVGFAFVVVEEGEDELSFLQIRQQAYCRETRDAACEVDEVEVVAFTPILTFRRHVRALVLAGDDADKWHTPKRCRKSFGEQVEYRVPFWQKREDLHLQHFHLQPEECGILVVVHEVRQVLVEDLL